VSTPDNASSAVFTALVEAFLELRGSAFYPWMLFLSFDMYRVVFSQSNDKNS
jgi:hypothetical protein